MNEEVYENYSGDSAESRAGDPKDNGNSYEDIYANEVPETQVTRSNDGTISRSNNGIISEPNRCFRVTVFCLLLLVVFLLVVITILWVKFNNLTKGRYQLETSFNNLTIERDQLQTSYNNLNMEKSQLQTSFNNLTIERDQLQTSYNNLNTEKSQLQTSYNNMAAEKERLSQLKKDINTPGWRYFSSSIYYISTEKKSWSESRKDCQGRGADLVIINNSEEQDFVEVCKRNQGAWIGANDRDSEGTWKWVDGTTVMNGFWNPGEPNNVGEKDCAVSGDYYTENGKWVDVSCNNNYIWICEKRLTL